MCLHMQFSCEYPSTSHNQLKLQRDKLSRVYIFLHFSGCAITYKSIEKHTQTRTLLL